MGIKFPVNLAQLRESWKLFPRNERSDSGDHFLERKNMLDYTHIIKAFCREKIHFAVAGGFASLAHGVVRVTMDLDLAIALQKEDLEKSWLVLESLGFRTQQPIKKEDFVNPERLSVISKEKDAKAISFYHPKQPYLVVDLLIASEIQWEKEDLVYMNLFNHRCPVLKLEKLIQLKEIAGRDKDLQDVRELKKLQKTKGKLGNS